MKTKTPIHPDVRTIESVPSSTGDNVFANSSAIVGTTLCGDLDDALAVLRTAVLLSRNLRARLFLGLPGMDVLPVHLDEAPQHTTVSELLDSARTQLRELKAPMFAMEVSIIVASFVFAGSITMRVRNVNAASERQCT